MTTPDPGVYISTTKMYDEVRELARAVGRIESKLDGLLDEQRDIRGRLADHETRLRTLERSRWPLPSLAAVVSVAALGVTLYGVAGR